MRLPGAGGSNGELLHNGYKVSVMQDEKFLRSAIQHCVYSKQHYTIHLGI